MTVLSTVDSNAASAAPTTGATAAATSDLGKPPRQSKLRAIMMESDDDDDDDDDEQEQDRNTENHHQHQQHQHQAPPRPSARSRSVLSSSSSNHPEPQSQRSHRRRRRRSSAHFLRLTGRFEDNDDDDKDNNDDNNSNDTSHYHQHQQQEQLGDMYKRAIRMNAENRINAGNSWGLDLIDNIDKFLVDESPLNNNDDDHNKAHEETHTRSIATATTTTSRRASRASSSKTTNVDDDGSSGTLERRVNFTKASCTLDASVKIYSYRVDDVHLTSYKVLANLNRTDTNNKDTKKTKNNNDNNNDEEGPTGDGDGEDGVLTANGGGGGGEKSRRGGGGGGGGVTDTLESNIANLNINKLDSAYDIDPLFHKMSKTFDEGGAKGLLLVNLGVGSQGCNIVFDSSKQQQQQNDDEQQQEEEKEPHDTDHDNGGLHEPQQPEGMIDITTLTNKLETLLGGVTVDSLPLVPQLRLLREEYAQLEAEGFVNHHYPSKKRSRRYASTEEEEKEAEMSIHQDALERSRVSQATLAQLGGGMDDDEDGQSYAAPDFGGGMDDDEDDFGFTDLVAADENGARYSSISFQNESVVEEAAPVRMPTRSTTAVVLDALCAGDSLQGNDYEFFSTEALEKLTSGNDWAGAAHWKKGDALRRKRADKKKKQKKRKTTKKKKTKQTLVDLSATPDLQDVLRKPPKSKKRGAADPLRLSKAMMTKYNKADNLLPPDAGIGMEALSTLFLRPKAVVRGGTVDGSKGGKTVGFDTHVASFGAGFDNGGNTSFGDNDEGDGGGFLFADDEGDKDFVIGELEGVRKVEKIQVGYATVAKKVDVKRLKKDLWAELENTFVPEPVEQMEQEGNGQDEGNVPEQIDVVSPSVVEEPEPKMLSFQETLKDIKGSQAQSDVTLPFYFICLLHLANEKGLRLESSGLEDLVISQDNGAAPSFGTLPTETATGESTTTIKAQHQGRAKEMASYEGMEEGSDSEEGLVDRKDE